MWMLLRCVRGLFPVSLGRAAAAVGFLALSFGSAEGQSSVWTARYNGNGQPSDNAVDSNDNVYVVGTILTSTQEDVVLMKYDFEGNRQWFRRFDGKEHLDDIGAKVAVDPAGHAIIAGMTRTTASGNRYEFVTAKYDPAGNRVWARLYGVANQTGRVEALQVDAAGNVYLACTVGPSGGPTDVLLVKYGSDGTMLWDRRYDGGDGTRSDAASAMAIASNGDAIVVGSSVRPSTGRDLLTLRFSAAGSLVWTRTHTGEAIVAADGASAAAIDATGAIFVAGTVDRTASGMGTDWVLLKYDASGSLGWLKYFNSGNGRDDWAEALALDGNGNAFVAGYAEDANGQFNMMTVKYAGSGTRLWYRAYDGPAGGDDGVFEMAADAEGSVVVTGSSMGTRGNMDVATIKYDLNGVRLWTRRFGAAQYSDMPASIVFDSSLHPIVTGVTWASTPRFWTVKYFP
ncbi:MAG TPA: hypothetical protein VGE01_08710 [Fimbriimonas sp.]